MNQLECLAQPQSVVVCGSFPAVFMFELGIILMIQLLQNLRLCIQLPLWRNAL